MSYFCLACDGDCATLIGRRTVISYRSSRITGWIFIMSGIVFISRLHTDAFPLVVWPDGIGTLRRSIYRATIG